MLMFLGLCGKFLSGNIVCRKRINYFTRRYSLHESTFIFHNKKSFNLEKIPHALVAIWLKIDKLKSCGICPF